MLNLPEKSKRSLSTPVLALSCLGLLMMSGMVVFTGCGGGANTQQEVKKEAPMTMSVLELEQRSSLDDKMPDGQFIIAKVSMKNNTNASIVLDPSDFVLQNITDNEKDRYSQPAEKGMSSAFGKVYGDEMKAKLMDLNSSNLYPRMQIERFFVFMVPSDAAVNGYQITYKPANISIPLVTSEATVINDHRNQAVPTNDEQSSQLNKP